MSNAQIMLSSAVVYVLIACNSLFFGKGSGNCNIHTTLIRFIIFIFIIKYCIIRDGEFRIHIKTQILTRIWFFGGRMQQLVNVKHQKDNKYIHIFIINNSVSDNWKLNNSLSLTNSFMFSSICQVWQNIYKCTRTCHNCFKFCIKFINDPYLDFKCRIYNTSTYNVY